MLSGDLLSGHEIGYHYEDLATAQGDYGKAIRLFDENLAKLRGLLLLRRYACMAARLSKYDNRKLWEKYDLQDFGITESLILTSTSGGFLYD